jgi:hypothetical protein
MAIRFDPCACPVCETSANSDSRYFARAFGDSRHYAATSEAVSDALGFCPRHGATLLSQDDLAGGIVRVLRDAIPHLMLLLNEEFLHEAQVQQILFGAGRMCPACTFVNRAAGRRMASLARQVSGAVDQTEFRPLDTLCVGHFQALAADLPPEPHLAALTRYADNLEQVATKLKMLIRTARGSDDWQCEDTASAIRDGLGHIAGRSGLESLLSDEALASILEQCPTLVDGIAFPDACSFCIEEERARQRWLQNVQLASAYKQDAWLLLPTCPQHVRAVARIGEPKLTSVAVSHALSLALRYYHQQIQILVRDAELKAEEAKVRAEGFDAWAAYKQKRDINKTKGRKIGTPRLAKCRGCEQINLAVDGATGDLLDLLQRRKYRNAFSRGYGLCMKHFARVYLVAPKGVVRSMLAEVQKDRLAEFARSLDETARGRRENETIRLRVASWRTALRRFCGFTR